MGGLTPGVKLLRTRPGIEQRIELIPLNITTEIRRELQERFALIYTGQRRLARNLLRDVVGGYVGGRPESVAALKDMQPLAVLMKYQLEKGDVDEFAKILNQHWELSKQLDDGCTNTCIDQISWRVKTLLTAGLSPAPRRRFPAGDTEKRRGKGRTEQETAWRYSRTAEVDVWESEIVWEVGKHMDKKYTIAVAGTGYVGLSIATLLSQHHKVYAVDIVSSKVELINQRKSPIQDEYIEKYLVEKELDLTATMNAEMAYSAADFVVIAAPTNYDSATQHFDTSAVESVINLVMKYNPEAIMVIKSTIPVGYTKSIREKTGKQKYYLLS